jgi:Secretion system C-terminal sorting domain
MTNKFIISTILIFCSLFGFSQSDTLLELTVNKSVRAFYNNNIDNPNSIYFKKSNPNNKAALTLPFLDDFSQNYLFPDQSKWENFYVYVNSNFSINPPSYGVATFDGLDSTGYPYNFGNPTAQGPADFLTSKVIDLTIIVDSVFLSFYYQPQGNGNEPEQEDSLRLEFFRNSDSTWVRQWGVGGSPSQDFKKVMIPVDTSFQNNAFQFRFQNYATLSGNVDHWNLDYVYLNDNRNYADTLLNDVSFTTNYYNMLSEFSSMPWDHYKTDTLGMMAKEMNVPYINNHTAIHPVFYKYEVRDNNGAGPMIELYPSTADFKNVNPGSVFTEPQAVYSVIPFINDFSFPTDNSTNKVFEIKNYFNLGSGTVDSLLKNDTVISHQVFGSYYAYDDGTAEVGYGVQGVGSKLAHQFDIKKSDTLTSIQIYFNPIKNNLINESFKLTIWASLNPEIVVYQQTSFYTPTYSFTNQFLNYPLETPIILPAGTYYFGYEKITANFLNVGWDMNTNNRNKVFLNALFGWQNPTPASIPNGSLMLRPVFGTTADPVVSIQESNDIILNDDFKVYPNPASTAIFFDKIGTISNSSYHVELINIYGEIVTSTETSLSQKLDVSNYSNGIYFIRFVNNSNLKVITKKVIISK